MRSVDEILNYMGDFTVTYEGNDIQLTGYLTKRGDNVVLECRVIDVARDLMNSNGNHRVCGMISGTNVTLLNCYISDTQFVGVDYSQGKFTLVPSEIVIGCQNNDNLRIKSITAFLKELNNMFSSRIVEPHLAFTRNNPSMLDFAFPESITAKTQDGEIRISRTVAVSSSRNEHSVQIRPFIEYMFNTPVEIGTAISKIASVRSLLTFFADYYLPWGELSITDKDGSGDDRYLLHLNFTENVDKSDYPFLIWTSAFENCFQGIWDSWQKFHSDNKHIAELFSEMITNHSRRANRFLNLCQCLEMYSCCYRNDEAEKVRNKDSESTKSITLKHRLHDLFLSLNRYLALSEDKCEDLAKTISGARNYFTHYNKKRPEPSFDCIAYSCEFLHFVLLLLVYELLGLPEEVIHECRNCKQYSNLDFFISKID